MDPLGIMNPGEVWIVFFRCIQAVKLCPTPEHGLAGMVVLDPFIYLPYTTSLWGTDVRKKVHTSYTILLLRQGNYTRFCYHRAPSTTAGCSCAVCDCCCCPVRLSAAPSACVRILSPRVFSMTDWYIGSAGRWISMTFWGGSISEGA
jgi:hypothetical protein